MTVDNDYYSFKKLEWDTNNIGIDTYELIFKKELTNEQKNEIEIACDIKALIYIKNPTANRENSKFIGERTKAVLYDTNIYFICKKMNITNLNLKEFVYNSINTMHFEVEEDFITFRESRFAKDLKLKSMMKNNIYDEWIKNSLCMDNKKLLTIENNNIILGYILYKLDNTSYTIELISVLQKYHNMKIGSNLINCLINLAFDNKINEIKVGTQISNLQAINFYIKNGFYVDSTTDIYHWWK